MPGRQETTAGRQRLRLEVFWRLFQLVFVVTGFYLGYALVLNLLDWLLLGRAAEGRSVSERIFDASSFRLDSIPGIGQVFAATVAFVWTIVLVYYVVERARQCLDYALSLFLIHCGACSLGFGLPASFLWWSWHLVGALLIGVFATTWRRHKDLTPIAVVPLESTGPDQTARLQS
ncbi:hypothetical protein CCYA_CCYA07G2077 [Cyanidiococcus yangmingshanensis]|nr:hypothetical protein CCYA_CCYA07G2077 [Cyanidiococcus yangmingshanensis]